MYTEDYQVLKKGAIVPMKRGGLCDVCLCFDLSDSRVTLEKMFVIELPVS